MQSDWAKTLLGAPRCRAGSWILWVIECGWLSRLGTKMLERAIMLKARAQILPP